MRKQNKVLSFSLTEHKVIGCQETAAFLQMSMLYMSAVLRSTNHVYVFAVPSTAAIFKILSV